MILEVRSVNVRLCLIEDLKVQCVSLILFPSMAAVLFTKPVFVWSLSMNFPCISAYRIS